MTTDQGEWLASPMRGAAIPAWEPHRVAAEGNTLLHSLFVDPDAHAGTFTEFRMVSITPLLHELIREAGRFFADYEPGSLEDRLLRLVVDLLPSQESGQATWLPEVGNPRIRRAIGQTAYGDLRTTTVADRAAYSTRQFARVFREDTGMAFKDWRALYRVHAAMRLLAQGSTVSETSAELGFSSASAFIALFKRYTGTTPSTLGRY